MRRTAYLLAATLLAVTFCADRSIAATPALRPEVTQLAGKLVSRLSQSFGRSATAVAMFPRRERAACTSAVVETSLGRVQPLVLQRLNSPFQFRLPPPAL